MGTKQRAQSAFSQPLPPNKGLLLGDLFALSLATPLSKQDSQGLAGPKKVQVLKGNLGGISEPLQWASLLFPGINGAHLLGSAVVLRVQAP